MRQGPILEVRGVSVRFGGLTALDDVSLTVAPSEVVGVIGPNGAGKSTTIRMFLALQRPTGGWARLLGLNASADSVEVHRRIGYLPGDLPRATGRRSAWCWPSCTGRSC